MTNFSLAVKAFIIDNHKLLILKREPKEVHLPNIWEPPGGRINPGEDPIEGVKRETKEETGLDIEIIHPLNIRHFTRQDGQIITMIIFLCKPKTNQVALSKEHVEHDWIHLKEDYSKLAEFFYPEVNMYLKNFSKQTDFPSD